MSGPENDHNPKTESQPARQKSFLVELKTRRVYQTAGAYAVIAWGATEILDGVIPRFGWPDWLATLVVILFVTGFPVAMFLAWVFDLTPGGIRRTEPWTAMGWLSIIAAVVFLVAGSGGLFWLIKTNGVARLEQVGITVLPCRYRGEQEYAYRAEGVAGVINDRLAHLQQLHVPAFSSVVKLSAQNMSTSELGLQVGVAWLVECRVNQQDDRWQLDTSLINVQTDESELVISLDVEMAEMVSTLESVTLALLGRLGLSNTQPEAQQRAGHFTQHVRSFDAYLKGEQAMRRRTAEDYLLARDYFHAAQQVPGFELAKVREADAFMKILDVADQDTDRKTEAGLRAIGLMLDTVEAKNPKLAELYVARMRLEILSAGLGRRGPPDQGQLGLWFDQAIELKPSYAEPYRLLAQALLDAGEKDRAETLRAKANRLDPAH
jgi:TolB-like protein